ncbi:MAG: adenosylcobinamide-GDP ribazoletransferase [Gaiellaceae bacterium]
MPAAELRSVAAAVAFLTRLPVGRWIELDAADVARGGGVFPIVGAGVGLAVGGIAQVLAQPLTPALAAVVGVAAGAALTGALHLDALADTADALGARTREQALEIMRDHAIGAYGSVALVLDIALKLAAVAVLASRHDAMRFVPCAGACSRAVPVVLSAALPYARPGAGSGRALAGTGAIRTSVAVAIAAAVCVVLHAPLLLAAAAGVGVLVAVAARHALGGITGDVLGAGAELAESAALVVAVALT